MEDKRPANPYDLSKFDLSPGNAQVIRAVRRQNPQLNDGEVEELSNIVLSEVGRRISIGEKMAFFSIDEDGAPSLTLLGLEVVQRHVPKLPGSGSSK